MVAGRGPASRRTPPPLNAAYCSPLRRGCIGYSPRSRLRRQLASQQGKCEAPICGGLSTACKGRRRARHAAELDAVDELANRLVSHIDDTRAEIAALHVHGALSKTVQDHFATLLHLELGFDEEVVLTPQSGFVTQARPDFFFNLGPGRGVIAEVERGGTTTNNHDLKDLWKAHLSPDSHHLFLIAPWNNWKADGSARERPFQVVSRRIGAFFGDPRREIDVLSAHIFAY